MATEKNHELDKNQESDPTELDESSLEEIAGGVGVVRPAGRLAPKADGNDFAPTDRTSGYYPKV